MDIIFGTTYPASALSNLAPHAFIFDGVPCASAEGPLQSFKYEHVESQRAICLLSGREAKRRGQVRNQEWRAAQCLWWKGMAYPRNSRWYQRLLDCLYESLFTNIEFRNALVCTGSEELTHSMGSRDPRVTILTEEEFCSRLMKLRERLLVRP